MWVIERRRRLSASPAREVLAPTLAPDAGSPWGRRLALALVLVGLLSALASVIAIIALAGAMGNAGPPQGPIDFLPVFAGSLLGVVGDLLLVRGGAGVLRPGSRFTGGRGSALAGILLQVPAAAAVGELEASVVITLLYVLLLAGLATLVLRLLPVPGPRPAARHPSAPLPAAPDPEARWTVRARSEPIQWVAGGTPPPPSAARAAEPGAAWERSQPRDHR